MDYLFLVFALFSGLLFVDGKLLNKGQLKMNVMSLFKKEDAEERVKLIGRFMMVTGVITFTWTLMGYLFYDLLAMEIIFCGYFIIIAIAGICLFVAFRTRFR
ncbi:hypothetical protein [Desemzia sp. FAM 23991]|uniref:hypothetical protein n=1 Tax=unclassified Desemzia TaxID=2685243 RepID=UPI0038878DFB